MTPLDPRLVERLERVADPLDGADWLDVRRRSQRATTTRRRRRPAILVAAAALALVLVVVIPAFGIGARLLEVLSLTEEDADVPKAPGAATVPPYVYGHTLYGVSGDPQELERWLAAPLLGQHDVSLAVPSPDDRFVVYHSARRFGPTTSLRILEVATGEDRVLARSAQSFAWHRDGRVAYWQASTPRYAEQRAYLGHVVVRSSLESPAETWTRRPGVYTVLGWARERLLVRSHACQLPGCEGLPENGVYTLAGPGALQALPLSDVTAISPDGRYAIGAWLPMRGQDSPSPFVRVVEIATGRVLAHADLRRAARGSVPSNRVAGGIGKGSWAGGRIAATAYGDGGARTLLLLSFARGSLAIERAFRLDDEVGAHLNFYAPVFTDTSGERIVLHAVADDLAPQRAVFLASCELDTALCRRGRELPPRRWLTLVYNPSRPAAAGGLLRSDR